MTRREFLDMHANAIEQANRIEYYSGYTKIIFVVSKDVLQMMTRMTEYITLCVSDNSAEYCGFPIAVINEDTHGFMRPALKGTVYYEHMMPDDLIVVDDENRIFKLKNKIPVQFVDTGFTVNYQVLNNEIGTATDSATFNRVPITFGVDMNRVFAGGWRGLIDGVGVVEHGTTIPEMQGHNYFPVRKSRKPKEQEEELDAGDTKLIDEFLNGFAHKESLQSAT